MEKKAEKTYVAIDLKSFYASVECVERGLDPLKARLVVADPTRTEKTICLAVSPALKAYGISGRARLFEVIEQVNRIKAQTGEVVDYLVAPPRMGLYMEYSTRIYDIYLGFVAPEDMHIYSVDEVFIDATEYLGFYHVSAHDFAMMLIGEVLRKTGITATAGIGPNLYLCKIAMDIEAKHKKPDENGVRVAELTERSYREKYWNHRPLTDFWRLGKGTQTRLEKLGLMTLGDVARCSLGGENDFFNEDPLFKTFVINAELLIDHAWGVEPCTIAQIKAYRPSVNSVSSGQVLKRPYKYDETRLIVREMTELLALDLVKKGIVTDQIGLSIGYDIENLKDQWKSADFQGDVEADRYGRVVPKGAHSTENLGEYTSSTHKIMDAMMRLFDRIADKNLLTRRVTVVANRVISEKRAKKESEEFVQLGLFDLQQEEKKPDERERKLQETMLAIQSRYGKNAILKGMNLQEGGTTIERNGQIGGHKA
ncbi:MAG: DNA methylase [Lachnospiraceae bacterium]|nr:DNA methylase [Lachnospiraceae bacterium]